MNEMNNFLCQRLAHTGVFTTFSGILFDFATNDMLVANAAQPPILHFQNQNNQCKQFNSDATFLGFEHPMPIVCSSIHGQFESGDKIIVYTDGLIESENTNEDQFGINGLEYFIGYNSSMSSAAFNSKLMETVIDFTDGPLEDDILIMTITIK